jgi:hypothetical protein
MFWIMAADNRASYALQRPDPNYAYLWEPVSDSLQRAAGVARPRPWAAADMDNDNPRFVSTWAWDMICLEEGAREPGGPRSSTHWPLSQEAVQRFNDGEEDGFTISDEEDGLSDASSLTDCYESDLTPLPTGLHWRLPGWEQRAPFDEPPQGGELQYDVEMTDDHAASPPLPDVHDTDADAEGEPDYLLDTFAGQVDQYAAGFVFQPIVFPELPDRTWFDWTMEPSQNWTPGPDLYY